MIGQRELGQVTHRVLSTEAGKGILNAVQRELQLHQSMQRPLYQLRSRFKDIGLWILDFGLRKSLSQFLETPR